VSQTQDGYIAAGYPKIEERQFMLAYRSEGKTKYKPIIGKAKDLV
jgi:hypothetical protein